MIAKNGTGGSGKNPAGLFAQGKLFLKDGTEFLFQSDNSWQSHTEVPKQREGRLRAPAKGWQPVHVDDGLDVWNNTLQSRARPLVAQLGQQNVRQPMVRASLTKNTAFMQSLGRPLREQIVSMRPDRLTTLEAIDLANDSALTKSLADGAQIWLDREFASTNELIEELFRSTLSRRPTDVERQLMLSALGDNPSKQSIQDALWAVSCCPNSCW